MSLPLARRIARAALLVGAAAAPLVGASAASAVELPQAADLGGLSKLDGAGVGNTVDSTSQKTGHVAGEIGGTAVKTAVPATGKAVGKAGKHAAPAAAETVGQATAPVGQTAKAVMGTGRLAGTLPAPRTLPATNSLSTSGLPVDGLPLGS